MPDEIVETSEVETSEVETEEEETAESKETDQDVDLTDADKVETTDNPDKFIVKVNGEELEVTRDELIQGYQTRKAADDKFREAANTRKQAEDFINLLKTNPKKVLSNPSLGIDFRELAEEYLMEQMEEEQMDPRDRELKEAREKLASIEEEKKQKEKEQQEQQAADLREKYTQEYQQSIIDTLQKSGLPKTEHTVKRMAYYMHQGLKRGYTLKSNDVVDLVKQDYITEQKSLYSGLDGDALIELLGDDVASKIRKHDVAKYSKKKSPETPGKQPEGGKQRPKKSNKISKDDWKARMDRIKNGDE